MKDMKNMTNQGGQGQGGKSKPSSRPPGEDTDRQRKDQEPSKQPGRPTPSGAPNEGRRAEGAYEYKGGRQGTGGIPNPDDRDDRESAGSFRGTAKPVNGTDDADADNDDGEQSAGAGQFRRDLISPIRNPE